MKSYSQVEGMLYNHYEKINNRDRYKLLLERTRRRIKTIEEDLKDCNFTLSDSLQSTDYSKEIVDTSIDNTSSMEKELIREETKLEKELKEEKRYKFKCKRKIRNIQKQIDDIEIILELLPMNYIEFIKYLYKDKLTYRKVAILLNCDKNVVARNKKEIIEKLRRIL